MDRQALNRIVDAVRDKASRIRLTPRHGVAAGAAVLAALAMMGLMRVLEGGGDAVADPGQRIQIEVVQPDEPEFTAGPVMEVGTLVDAFQPGDLPLPIVAPDDVEPHQIDEPKAAPPLLRRFSRFFGAPGPQAEKPVEAPHAPEIRREDRAYGFDAPRPDWEAERQARRAWRERVEAERRDREMRQRMDNEESRPPSDAPVG